MEDEKKKIIAICLTEEVHEIGKKLAKEDSRSFSSYIAQLIMKEFREKIK